MHIIILKNYSYNSTIKKCQELKNTLTHNLLLTILFEHFFHQTQILYNILIQVDFLILTIRHYFFSLEEKIHHSLLVSDYCHLFFRFMKLSDIFKYKLEWPPIKTLCKTVRKVQGHIVLYNHFSNFLCSKSSYIFKYSKIQSNCMNVQGTQLNNQII